MKQITLKIHKPRLLLGITLAILVILFIKYRSSTTILGGIEPFLANPIRKINSLCRLPYNTPKIQPTAKPPTFNLKPPVPTPGATLVSLTPKSNNTCKLGININPPTPTTKQAINTLTAPVSTEQVKIVEQLLVTIPEFTNVLNSPRKEEIIREIIIVNKLVSDPNITLSQSDINHIVTVIISDINTVDPQIASAMVEYYSESVSLPETNAFSKVVLTVPDIELNSDAKQIITSEPIIPLTPESEQQIVELFTKIKKDIQYDDCIDILTGRKRTN